MTKFRKAIADSLHHWPMLLLATLCSLGVATLWSANIGAMYPVIEMTLRGESTQKRIAAKVAVTETKILQLEEEAKLINSRLATAVTLDERRETSQQLQACSALLRDTQASLDWERWQLRVAERLLPDDPFRTICLIMLVLVLSTALRHVLMLTNDLLVGKVSTTIARSLRMRVFDQALAFDRGTYQSYGTSGLLATITHTSEGLANGLIAFFGLAIREPLRVAFCLIGAAILCWRLLLLSVLLAPLFVLVVYWFNGRVKSIARSMLVKNTGFHEVILEALSNIFTVQAYTMEPEERKRFASCTKDMQRCGLRMILYTGLSKPLTELIGVGMIAITVCSGAYLIVNRETHIFFLKICDEPLTAATLMIFFAMLIGASDPLRKMSGVMTAIYGGNLAAESLYQILERPQLLEESKTPQIVKHPHSKLSIRDVHFAYTPDREVLRDISLDIPFGKCVAIVGANGCGKSTLIQLICRFYDPQHGSLSLDEVDYKQMSIASLRGRIALVSQQTELFNRSVMENIRYGSPQSTHEEAISAAKIAFAHDFITNSLERGYETIVGQGGQCLSGGQRQRIAMARAILRKPEILILDESTSQIDMVSELQIRQSLLELKGTCTILIITHRVALISLADSVYEINDGLLHPYQNPLKVSA
jgi:ATP-binding cassette, subfamily B, bacterial MsbA